VCRRTGTPVCAARGRTRISLRSPLRPQTDYEESKAQETADPFRAIGGAREAARSPPVARADDPEPLAVSLFVTVNHVPVDDLSEVDFAEQDESVERSRRSCLTIFTDVRTMKLTGTGREL
jgi:hypothetical protein